MPNSISGWGFAAHGATKPSWIWGNGRERGKGQEKWKGVEGWEE